MAPKSFVSRTLLALPMLGAFALSAPVGAAPAPVIKRGIPIPAQQLPAVEIPPKKMRVVMDLTFGTTTDSTEVGMPLASNTEDEIFYSLSGARVVGGKATAFLPTEVRPSGSRDIWEMGPNSNKTLTRTLFEGDLSPKDRAVLTVAIGEQDNAQRDALVNLFKTVAQFAGDALEKELGTEGTYDAFKGSTKEAIANDAIALINDIGKRDDQVVGVLAVSASGSKLEVTGGDGMFSKVTASTSKSATVKPSGYGGSSLRDAPPPCEDGAARLEALWGAERRAALAAVVGEAAWPAIEQRVQARADGWADTYAQACRATWVNAVADEASLHRRMLCLESRRDELDATLAALQSGSRTAVGNAAEAIDLLPASEACLEPEALGSEAPLPSDPALRVEIARVQRAVAEAGATVLDPALLDSEGKGERAVALARATGWAPVIADALIVRGAIAFDEDHSEQAVTHYEEATHLALAAGSDALAVEALVGAAWPLADRERVAEATQVLKTARALWERLGQPAYEERLLLGAEAHVALRDHRPRDALAKTREQILILRIDRKLPWLDVARALAGEDELPDDELTRRSATLRKRFARIKSDLKKLLERNPTVRERR